MQARIPRPPLASSAWRATRSCTAKPCGFAISTGWAALQTGGRLVAEAKSVLVGYDYERGESVAIPDR